jgi:hypothetical protein
MLLFTGRGMTIVAVSFEMSLSNLITVGLRFRV